MSSLLQHSAGMFQYLDIFSLFEKTSKKKPNVVVQESVPLAASPVNTLEPRPSNPLLFFGLSQARLRKHVLNEVTSGGQIQNVQVSYITHAGPSVLLEVLEAYSYK